MELIIIMLLIAGAFVIQMGLGFLQIKHFTKGYSELRRMGKVAIGKKPGRIKAGTIVLFAINKNGRILAAKKMQGVTVMAKFRDLPGFLDKNIRNLKEEDLKHCNKLLRDAILDASNNYKIIMNGGVVPEKDSFFKRMMIRAENAVSFKK
ncbi:MULTISPECIES: transcriptional regulator GutM [Niallia]|jgi:glucitol operon activator protein|uniref:Transcriptional regulator n=1 Tax=Niallia circulans TaxID=1397 RepID=A0A268FDN8_NIACI|nr:transcriptional regulator GutM [Niallia circulans]AYV65485.1 transcriptional regulator [Niallia circulans]NRG25681.1 transcriptional regulator GutM [Niallia circulans]PAD83494.1 transcriptional regulator [Niallia circulans]